MVIIGLLLGGVLKGQELINNAKIRRIANDLSGISTAIYAYQDRYKALPGDDSGASSRWGTGVSNGDRGERSAGISAAIRTALQSRSASGGIFGSPD